MMNFKLNDEQTMVRNMAREFAKSECLPGVIVRDEEHVAMEFMVCNDEQCLPPLTKKFSIAL